MTILERDKERGRRRSLWATPRTRDAGAAQNRPARGEANLLTVCVVAPPWSTAAGTPASSRLAYGQNLCFQNFYYLGVGQ